MASEKIPVVYDEEHIVRFIRGYLERDGYRVVVAYDGR